jgi:hypothetical protein
MTVWHWLLLAAVTALAAARVWRAGRPARALWPEAAAGALIPVLLCALAYCYVATLQLNTRWGWSADRLAPTIGLFHGYPLYSPIDKGPINGWLHGPLAPILWSPAALADSPQPALAIAAAINLVFMLSPLLYASVRFSAGSILPGMSGFVYGAAGLLLVYPTWYMASVLCSDAIAVALGLGSCLVLMGGAPPGARRLVLAALLGVLAAWTKQTEAPLVVAQLGWLACVHGWRTSLRYGALFAAVMAVAAGAVFGLMQPRDVILNMWTIPSSQKLTGSWAAAWTETADFLRYTLGFSVPCLLVLLPGARSAPSGRPGPGIAQAVALPISAALVMLPLGVMAAMKVGGDRNSIHSVYYLAGAAIVAIAHVWSPSPPRAGVLRGAALLACSAAAVIALRLMADYPSMSMVPPRCLSQQAWIFSRQHPGQTYFAQDPLATVMAEGRMYHFDYAVLDREHAGIVTSAKHIREGLPEAPLAVVYPRTDDPHTVLTQFLPEFVFSSATEDFIIYRRRGGK